MLLCGILVFLLVSSDLSSGLLCSDLLIKRSLVAAQGLHCGVGALRWACRVSLAVVQGLLLLQHGGSVVAACGPSCPRACAAREGTSAPCTGRQVLNHSATREVRLGTLCSLLPLPSSLTSLCPHFLIVFNLFVCKFVCYHLPLTLH